jgi:hypothetical protein
MKSVLLCALMLTACGKKTVKLPTPSSEIAVKAELYKSLHKGWAHSKCDSLGFSALGKLAGGLADVDINLAEGEPGRWYRSPEHDCFDLGQSASDISKDMFVMLLPYLFVSGDQANLQEIYSYGKSKGWVMGRGPVSRTILTPPIIYKLQVMINKVEPVTTSGLDINSLVKAGYEKHLDVINWMTQAIMKKSMSTSDYEQLRQYSEAEPRNAIMSALYHKFKDGNQAQTVAILMDETLFPNDRLPTPRDRCEEYLWQRDNDPKDWGPCDIDGTHDGVDFLLAAYVAGLI